MTTGKCASSYVLKCRVFSVIALADRLKPGPCHSIRCAHEHVQTGTLILLFLRSVAARLSDDGSWPTCGAGRRGGITGVGGSIETTAIWRGNRTADDGYSRGRT